MSNALAQSFQSGGTGTRSRRTVSQAGSLQDNHIAPETALSALPAHFVPEDNASRHERVLRLSVCVGTLKAVLF